MTVVSGPIHGQLTENPDGTYHYDPDAHWAGADSAVVSYSDGILTSQPVTIWFEVRNHAPTLGQQRFTSVHDRTLENIDPLSSAFDLDGDAMSVSILSGPLNGQLISNADGTYDYLPNPSWTGIELITMAVGDGVAMATGSLTISVSNAIPQFSNHSYFVLENGSLDSLDLRSRAFDLDGDGIEIIVLAGPVNGQLSQNVDGTYGYIPNLNWNGIEVLTLAASDDVSSSIPGTVTFIVGGNGPSVSEVVFDNNAPTTNDTLTAQVSNPSSASGSPISFQYTWTVNGEVVRNITSSSTLDSLDLSQSGFGDKGATVQLSVTPSDSSGTGASVFASLTIQLHFPRSS
jgi:hypothetical protein